MPDLQPFTFGNFGGLRLDQGLDEVGPEAAIFLRDVDWDGSIGKIRSRDGFAKLKSAEATGTYKALFPHSSTRIIATKRIKSTECKIVAIDKEGAEKTSAAFTETAARVSFTRYGTPSASYTYCRAQTSTATIVRFDGTEFTEPTATVGGESGKAMPKGNYLATWPDGGNRLVVANTGSSGGPNGLTSSNSHVWFSEPGSAEKYETTAYVQLSPGDGEEITALAVYGGQVFAFKETKFFVFYSVSTDSEGKPVFNFQEVTLGEGARVKRPTLEALAESSDQLACSAPTGVYFCTTDGIYVTTGGPPTKVSTALQPLEEAADFDGPMADLLNGSLESFRWPASGIVSLGSRIVVKRYEFMFVYDIPTDAWTCWKMPAVSLAVWTGLTGGGSEALGALPGTAEDNSGTGTSTWNFPNEIKVTDKTFANTVPELGESHYLKATNFGFAVPETATVAGIVVIIWREAVLGISDSKLKLVKAGTIQTPNAAVGTKWPEAYGAGVYGGPENLWEGTWTPSQINNSGFGCVLSVTSAQKSAVARVDSIGIAVYYTLPSSATGVRPRLFVTQSKSLWVTQPSAKEEAATREPEWQSGFYDLGSADEKTLRECDLWGTGEVDVSVAKDFGEVGGPTTFELGETHPERRQINKTQEGSMFSHRFSGEGPWQVQRITRYAQVEGEPGKQGRE